MQKLFTQILLTGLFLISFGCQDMAPKDEDKSSGAFAVGNEALATTKLLERAAAYLAQPPVPITSATSERSQGGPHDFYSEGDYWWPDPEKPDGPYIRRDGKTNPGNFVAHRQAMRKLNEWVSTLVSAYKLTGDQRFADHAMAHLSAFFLDPATLMNPSLLYAQGIKGRVSGRGIGIIDTIHLIEVARAIEVLAEMGYLKGERLTGLKDWFGAYATWMNTHEYGLKEKDHGNNHSTWWAAQMAAFAHLTENEALMDVARSQFKKLLSAQMANDGGFPDELERTKPYNYTLFNLEGYALLCEIASSPSQNLWTYEGENGSIRKAWAFIQTTGLLLAAKAYESEEMIAVWKALSPERKVEEVNRNFPVREPVLWLP